MRWQDETRRLDERSSRRKRWVPCRWAPLADGQDWAFPSLPSTRLQPRITDDGDVVFGLFPHPGKELIAAVAALGQASDPDERRVWLQAAAVALLRRNYRLGDNALAHLLPVEAWTDGDTSIAGALAAVEVVIAPLAHILAGDPIGLAARLADCHLLLN